MFSFCVGEFRGWTIAVLLIGHILLFGSHTHAQAIYDTVWEINKASTTEVETHARYLVRLGFSGVVLSVAPLEQHIGFNNSGVAFHSVSGCQKDYSNGSAGVSFIEHDEGGCDTGKIENVSLEYLSRFRDKQNIYRRHGLQVVLLPLWARDWVAELVGFYGNNIGSIQNGVEQYCAALSDIVIDPLSPPAAVLFGGDFQTNAAPISEKETIAIWEKCLQAIPSDIKLGYHTGSWNDPMGKLRSIFGPSKPEWLDVLALQTGHSNSSPSHNMLKVQNWVASAELWSGESQYRDIDIVGNGFHVSAQNVLKSSNDLICSNRRNGGVVPVYFYGHNARWQWINSSHPEGQFPIGYSSTALSTMGGKNMSDEYKLVNRWKSQQCCQSNPGNIDCNLDRIIHPPELPIGGGGTPPGNLDYPLVFNPPVYVDSSNPNSKDRLSISGTLFSGRAVKSESIPVSFAISHFEVYPRPFKTELKVEFRISHPVYARLGIYDILGSLIREVVFSTQRSGDYIHSFDNLDLVPGSYLIQLRADSETTSKIVTKLR